MTSTLAATSVDGVTPAELVRRLRIIHSRSARHPELCKCCTELYPCATLHHLGLFEAAQSVTSGPAAAS